MAQAPPLPELPGRCADVEGDAGDGLDEGEEDGADEAAAPVLAFSSVGSEGEAASVNGLAGGRSFWRRGGKAEKPRSGAERATSSDDADAAGVADDAVERSSADPTRNMVPARCGEMRRLKSRKSHQGQGKTERRRPPMLTSVMVLSTSSFDWQ